MTQEPLSHQYLVQRIAVAVQRGNAAAVLGTVSGVSDVFHAFVIIMSSLIVCVVFHLYGVLFLIVICLYLFYNCYY